MRTFGVLWCCCLPLLSGCGGSLDKPVDPAEATTLLTTAFDAWKKGEAYGELAKRRPPIYFSEPAWESGGKLLKYEAGPVTLMGRQGRCSVKVTIQDVKGKVSERAIGYLIDTTPQLVITREALGR
jgi:hypothetical protein